MPAWDGEQFEPLMYDRFMKGSFWDYAEFAIEVFIFTENFNIPHLHQDATTQPAKLMRMGALSRPQLSEKSMRTPKLVADCARSWLVDGATTRMKIDGRTSLCSRKSHESSWTMCRRR
jgi:hypothetical protein